MRLAKFAVSVGLLALVPLTQAVAQPGGEGRGEHEHARQAAEHEHKVRAEADAEAKKRDERARELAKSGEVAQAGKTLHQNGVEHTTDRQPAAYALPRYASGDGSGGGGTNAGEAAGAGRTLHQNGVEHTTDRQQATYALPRYASEGGGRAKLKTFNQK